MTARLDPRHRAAFATNASPEAVAAHLRTARDDLRRLERHIAWLEDLHTRRTTERAAGEWPAPEETDQ